MRIFKADLIIKGRPPVEIYVIDLKNRQFIVYSNSIKETIPFEDVDNLVMSISGIPIMFGVN